MIDLSSSSIRSLVIHRVGNKHREEGFLASHDLQPVADEDLHGLLTGFFLDAFKNEVFHAFTHETDLALNEIYTYCGQVFESEGSFLAQSVAMLKHLYERSDHPNIKSGEFAVAFFEECVVEDEMVDAVGIFKIEHRDIYLQFPEREAGLSLNVEEGVNIKKLDKGCIVFNTGEESGYKVLVADAGGREAQFWREDFLHIDRIDDDSYQTDAFLSMVKNFSEEVIGKQEDKKEQLVFVNKSLDYFSRNEQFDEEEFTDEVMQTPDRAQSFHSFRQNYEAEQETGGFRDFNNNQEALKKMQRKFRTSVKLDTGIEIRMKPGENGNLEHFLERGYDEGREMSFYKVFFNKET